ASSAAGLGFEYLVRHGVWPTNAFLDDVDGEPWYCVGTYQQETDILSAAWLSSCTEGSRISGSPARENPKTACALPCPLGPGQLTKTRSAALSAAITSRAS